MLDFLLARLHGSGEFGHVAGRTLEGLADGCFFLRRRSKGAFGRLEGFLSLLDVCSRLVLSSRGFIQIRLEARAVLAIGLVT